MKAILTFFITSIVCFSLTGQSIDRSVISSFGSHFQNASFQSDATVGEVAIQSFKSGSLYLTQGFHQNEDRISTSVNEDTSSDLLRAWPIPANNVLHLEINEDLFARSYKIFNLIGVSQNEGIIHQKNETIDLVKLKEGAYILALLDENAQIIATKKFMKLK